MDVLSDKLRKARKSHICDWCKGEIQIGDIYKSSTCVNDGYIYTWKNHEMCSYLFRELNMYDNDDGYGIDSDSFNESVWEYLYKNLTEDAVDEIDNSYKAALKAYELIKLREVEI